MEATRKFTGPNVLIGVGLLPFVLWAIALGTSVKYGLGLSDIMLAGLFGVAAYLLTMAVCAAGFLWADRRANKLHTQTPRTTRILASVVALVLLAPWVFVLGRALLGTIR